MSLYLPIAFLLLQLIVLAFFGPAVTGPAAYILMVIAPLFAAAATLWRGRSHTTAVRFGWYALSLALTIWAVGAFGNLWQEMILHRQNEMYRASMLAFNLAVVPTTYLLASDWRLHGRQLLRAVDGLVALALGCAYFQYTWTMINDHSAPAEAGVTYLVWLLDLQNLYLAAGALVRWYVAEDRDERDLFRGLGSTRLSTSSLFSSMTTTSPGTPPLGRNTARSSHWRLRCSAASRYAAPRRSRCAP
jgi:hypothetical protein